MVMMIRRMAEIILALVPCFVLVGSLGYDRVWLWTFERMEEQLRLGEYLYFRTDARHAVSDLGSWNHSLALAQSSFGI